MLTVWFTLVLSFLAMAFAIVLATLLVRLLWHGGSYLKRKCQSLD